MRVTVYAGSASGSAPIYRHDLDKFVRELVLAGHSLVYGGGRTGLMGVAADAALSAGGHVTGVIPRSLIAGEGAHPDVDLCVVETMHERKHLMADLGDAFVAAPGSVGTLEELMEVWAWLILGDHQKPVMMLNTEGFWDPQFHMIQRMMVRGFLQRRERDSIFRINSSDDFAHVVDGWTPPPVRWSSSRHAASSAPARVGVPSSAGN